MTDSEASGGVARSEGRRRDNEPTGSILHESGQADWLVQIGEAIVFIGQRSPLSFWLA